jgi:NAD(P)-dependent dehydrogenase (short-subunit alcohol dehydrogenase family)
MHPDNHDNDRNDSNDGASATRREALIGMGAIGVALAAGADSAQAAPGAAPRGGSTTARELTGKVAIVTGARNNLGRAFAVALARMGADVLVHYHRAETRKEADETARLVRAHRVKAVLVDGDLSVVANVRRMFDTAKKDLGRVDIVVNNAGYIRKKPIAEITEAEFERAVGINTRGLFYCMQEAARRIADNGRVINIGTSLLGATTGMYGAYAGTKAPVEQFTRALAKELGARGITVNTIAPGAVDTPFFHGEETPQSVEYVKKSHVAGRLATVDEIVGTLEFLASSRAQWVSAQTIFVNNGYLAR